MLEELSKKDKLWRNVAFKICRCKDTSNELVQSMYLKVYEKNLPIEKLTESYVICILFNLYKDHLKQRTNVNIDDLFIEIADEESEYYFNDEDIAILEKANDLKWWQKQLLVESYDKSLRQIEKEFNINYVFVQRHTTKAKKYILGEDYKPYQNKRLKNKNNKK